MRCGLRCSSLAAQAAARAAPDGYTLFITSTTTTSTNQLLFKKLPYDPVKDFTPVGNIIEAYYMLAVPSSLPVKTVPELVSWLKANSKTASYGWGAAVSQIGGATFLKEVNVSAAGIPYKSSPQSVTDLIGGQLSFMVLDVTSGLAHVKNDRVRALMVSSKKRIPQLPNVPTAAEAGVPGFDAATFVGMLAPAGTPAPVVDKLSAALQKALRKPAMVERMDSCCSVRLVPSSPSEFDEYLKKDRTSWANKITALGIQPGMSEGASVNKELFEKGLAVRREVVGTQYVEKSLAAADDFNMPMQELVTQFCWGEVWTRPGLDRRSRSILNLGMIAALNRPEELAVHVRGAINNGVTKEEIQECLLQVAVYCGMPAGLGCFKVAREVLKEMGV